MQRNCPRTAGSWATSPTAYHPDFGFDGTITLHGPGGGTVKVTYSPLAGVLSGEWTETYSNYSDNGSDFVDGTVAISSSTEAGSVVSHLTMTGANTGNVNVDFNFGTGVSGDGESTYDGHTVSDPSTEQAAKGACPDIQPKERRYR
jgi:hypothetical protein